MTEDKLEGTGLPAHGLVFLDVSFVLALPLYLYVEPWGRNLEQKPPQSRFCLKGKSPTRTPGPNATILGVWPRARRQGLRRLAPGLRKTPFAPTYNPVGLTHWPNHIIQYMNLYLQTILDLLVVSVISSGTPSNIRSPTYITHIILYRQRTLSMRTLRVRELCRHDRDTSLVNNQ